MGGSQGTEKILSDTLQLLAQSLSSVSQLTLDNG